MIGHVPHMQHNTSLAHGIYSSMFKLTMCEANTQLLLTSMTLQEQL